MIYSGLTFLGSGKTVGLYGLNDDIVDQKGTGLQSLYINDYEESFIHTAATAVLIDGELLMADRIYRKKGHPLKQATQSYVEGGYRMVDKFNHKLLEKVDKAEMVSDTTYLFQTEVTNTSNKPIDVTVAAILKTENLSFDLVKKNDEIRLIRKNKSFKIYSNESDNIETYIESPTGFMHRTTESFFYDLETFVDSKSSDHSIGIKNYVNQTIQPNETYKYYWVIETNLDKERVDFLSLKTNYWEKRLEKHGDNPDILAPLTALIALNLSGYIPADLTSHYFTDGGVSFYVRDALMASRAFLYAGYYKEFEDIINKLMAFPLKENNEFFQRYNALGQGSEGANNKVYSQIDSIGYFGRVVSDYYILTGKMLASDEYLDKILSPLTKTSKKNGLYGPEGGVNEGVYGPAFITSSNMFIAGGLKGLVNYFKDNNKVLYKKYDDIYKNLVESIENNCFDKESNYYSYGYVTYHDDIIHRYDTPQLLATSLGYPISNQVIKNYDFLKNHATYFKWGFGYSEQEYHDGPWIFNTAGAAQTAYLIDEKKDYQEIVAWLNNHKNGYGMLPEAIWARYEERTHINPLMWANSEYVCALLIEKISEVREIETT